MALQAFTRAVEREQLVLQGLGHQDDVRGKGRVYAGVGLNYPTLISRVYWDPGN